MEKGKTITFAAGIVTFNPDLQRLKENIESLVKNELLGKIFIVDNASENINELKELLNTFPTVTLIGNGQNYGIAYALNVICQQAQQSGFDWLMTLDQDSVLQPNILQEYAKHTADVGVGIICPRIEDRNMGRQYATTDHGWEKIDQCITSGNLVNLTAWKEIGGFDEKLFIDGVDFDFCIRMRKAGYGILRSNNVYLLQEVGKGRSKSLFGKTFSIMNHGGKRLYYIIRNYLYLGKKHHQRLHWTTEVGKRVFIVMTYEHHRLQKLGYMLRGLVDFVRGKMGKLE